MAGAMKVTKKREVANMLEATVDFWAVRYRHMHDMSSVKSTCRIIAVF